MIKLLNWFALSKDNNDSIPFKPMNRYGIQHMLDDSAPLSVPQASATMQTTKKTLSANHAIHEFRFAFALAMLFSMGCAGGQGILGVDEQADFPAGALPEKSGQKACRWHQAQATNAAIDRNVFYRADFIGNTAQIAPAAAKKFVERIQFADSSATLTIILEPSENPQLDQLRVGELTTLAGQFGVGNAEFQIGFPPALGLLGSDAERLGRSATSNGNNGGGGTGGLGNTGGFGRSGSASSRGF